MRRIDFIERPYPNIVLTYFARVISSTHSVPKRGQQRKGVDAPFFFTVTLEVLLHVDVAPLRQVDDVTIRVFAVERKRRRISGQIIWRAMFSPEIREHLEELRRTCDVSTAEITAV